MRTIVLLITSLLAINTFSQEILSANFSSCLKSAVFDSVNCSGTNFHLQDDTLRIFGKITANCCTDKSIYSHQSNDTMYLEINETGSTCKCICEFCFEVNYKLSDDGSIVNFENEIFQKAGVLGMTGNTDYSISFFPNPAKYETTIILSQPYYSKALLTISDYKGIRILSSNIFISGKEYKLITDLSPGFYIISLEISDFKIIGKLIIE